MRCELFRTDPASLISALGGEAMLRRYQAATAAELPALADRQLLAHLRRLDALAGRALAHGFTALATQDAAAADALLTDVFAVATWQGWELPAERLADDEIAVDGLARGLLGADPGRDGAALWILDPGRVALARLRQASGDAEWHPHHPEGGCRH